MSDEDLWSPEKGSISEGYTAEYLITHMSRRAEDTLLGRPPTLRMVDGGFYWIETRTGWVVAKYESGDFWESGKDHSTVPLAISGPLTPPANNTTKP